MKVPFVDLKAQYESIRDEIDAAISGVICESAFIGGTFVESFEKSFAEFCGAKHCIGVGNGTDALFIALRVLGIGPGDSVVVPANSFIATSEAVTLAGARAVFADIDPRTYNIDVNKLEHSLRKGGAGRGSYAGSTPRAVIPVHLYGQPADMDPVLELARKYDMRVVEDAAQAHGAEYKGRRTGSIGEMACFSFYPGKNLGAYGDGGAITTNDDQLALKARMFSNHGRLHKYDHKIEGMNSRLDGLQAAVLAVKLRHLTEWTEKRRKNACLYNEYLKDTDLSTPVEINDVIAVYHLYVVRTKRGLRDQLREHLNCNGISTGIHYPVALPALTAYSYLEPHERDCPLAMASSQEILSLPMYAELEETQIKHVSEIIRELE